MKQFHPIIVDTWRRVSCAVSLDQVVQELQDALKRKLPVSTLALWSIRNETHRLEQLTSQSCLPNSIQMAPSVTSRLLQWANDDEPLPCPDPLHTSLARLLYPKKQTGQMLFGPLCHRDEVIGLLSLTALLDRELTSLHTVLLGQILEPISLFTAHHLENTQQRAKFRATEAKCETLLAKLGRAEVSEEIIGAHGGLAEVMKRVNLVAPGDTPVLVLGETGTGKEVIARAIHDRSSRRQGPLLRVNCAAIPSQLIDSELFGHERGSFTGASSTRKGWFERADKGTLLLDEVGELPAAGQARLLRIVQDGSYERVGGGQTRQVDVRLVASTNADLKAMVANGTFREDLWYRLAVFTIELPPLRHRLSDIPDLSVHFARRASRRLSLPMQLPTERNIDALLTYDWPGNIRELAAVIDRAAILGNGSGLDIEAALGPMDRLFEETQKNPPYDEAEPLCDLDTAIRRHIAEALKTSMGRIEGPGGAANLLNLNPHTLRSKMRRLGIDWTLYRGSHQKELTDTVYKDRD